MANQAKVVVISRTFEEVCTEFELNQRKWGDCKPGDFVLKLSKITHLDLRQNNISELVHIWEGWDKAKQT